MCDETAVTCRELPGRRSISGVPIAEERPSRGLGLLGGLILVETLAEQGCSRVSTQGTRRVHDGGEVRTSRIRYEVKM